MCITLHAEIGMELISITSLQYIFITITYTDMSIIENVKAM